MSSRSTDTTTGMTTARHSSAARLHQPSHPLRNVKALCERWDNAWKSLTTSPITRDSAESNYGESDQPASLYLRVWALVDVPFTNRHDEEFEDAEERILDIVHRVPPPHVPLGPGEFRLMRLVPRASNEPIRVSLNNIPVARSSGNYSAISYCWGPQTQSQKVLLLNGRPVMVSGTLLTMLRHMSKLSDGYLWVDALCIRQDKIPEKNMQIPLMGRIYSEARFVDIWLGPDEEDSEYVLGQITQANAGFRTLPRFMRSFTKILERPWFKRLWVMQELVLAAPHAPVLRSGLSSCPWKSFAALIEGSLQLYKELLPLLESSLDMDGIGDMADFLARRKEVVDMYDAVITLGLQTQARDLVVGRNQYWSKGFAAPQNPMLLWVFARSLQTTDPRDKVYGVLGMACTGLAHEYAVDYNKPVSQVYLDATASVMIQGRAAFYTMIHALPVLSTLDKFDQESPSWAFDFSYVGCQWAENLQGYSYYNYMTSSKYRKSSERRFRFDYQKRELEVSASIIDDIAHLFECRTDPSPKAVSAETYLQAVEEADEREKAEFMKFLIISQKAYMSSLEAAEVWTHGQREPLWKLFLSLPNAKKTMEKQSFALSEQECSEKYHTLIDQPPPDSNSGQEDLFTIFKHAGPFGKLLLYSVKEKSLSGGSVYLFVTTQGLSGFCKSGARVGDTVSVLFRDGPDIPDIPFIIRPREDGRYSMVSVAWVPKNWEDLSRFRGTLEPRDIIFR